MTENEKRFDINIQHGAYKLKAKKKQIKAKWIGGYLLPDLASTNNYNGQ